MLCKRLTIPLTERGCCWPALRALIWAVRRSVGPACWIITCTAGYSCRVRKHEGTRSSLCFPRAEKRKYWSLRRIRLLPDVRGQKQWARRPLLSLFSPWGPWNALGGFVGISPAVPLHSLMHFMPHPPSTLPTRTNSKLFRSQARKRLIYLLSPTSSANFIHHTPQNPQSHQS